MTVEIKESHHGHRGIGAKFLVTGMAKRAIIVVIRPCHNRGVYWDSMMLAYHAAKEAKARGWKVIYVIPDYYEGDTPYFVNAAGFHERDEHNNSHYLCPGDYLGDKDYLKWTQPKEGSMYIDTPSRNWQHHSGRYYTSPEACADCDPDYD